MSKPRVLILGGTGMAGHVVYTHLDKLGVYEMHNTVFRTKLNAASLICDLTHKESVHNVFEKIKPHFVVNCVGALLKESENNPKNAILLNAWLPYYLSDLSNEFGCKLVHISTDCVFSGNRGEYRDTDFRDADDMYGRSKSLGELINDRDVTIRTSIIGPELKQNGEGLLHWFLNQQGEIFGYTQAYWSGITTLELAKQIEQIIENFMPGLKQLAPSSKISKYQLLQKFKKTFSKNIDIHTKDDVIVDKSLIPTVGAQVPNYEIMIEELYDFMINHKEFYTHYF